MTHVCVRAYVRACVRACGLLCRMRACVRAVVRLTVGVKYMPSIIYYGCSELARILII